MIHDLDNILVSKRVEQVWLAYVQFQIDELRNIMPNLASHEIPDEQFKEFPDESGEIFVSIRGRRIAMKVPKSEWCKKRHHSQDL